jgi:hypothetical protein
MPSSASSQPPDPPSVMRKPAPTLGKKMAGVAKKAIKSQTVPSSSRSTQSGPGRRSPQSVLETGAGVGGHQVSLPFQLFAPPPQVSEILSDPLIVSMPETSERD